MVFLGSLSSAFAQEGLRAKEAEVAMRWIGHQLYLETGDSTTAVPPVTFIAGEFGVSFEPTQPWMPSAMVPIIDKAVSSYQLPPAYIVELVPCDSQKVMYSYSMLTHHSDELIPCGTRELPPGCYTVFIEFKGDWEEVSVEGSTDAAEAKTSSTFQFYFFAALVLLSLMLIRWWLNRKKKGSSNSHVQNAPTSGDHVIALGTLQFDTRHSLLFREEVKIELTSKEADLLHVLYQNQNQTVNREDLLNSVWGDEGDYVGRTLDVYISKLRKKLEGEPLVKIVNTRGVGYKLILDTPS
ncbi:MAG: hypothetical protein SchgKO_16470 [Schleiferiaceae bacterium]